MLTDGRTDAGVTGILIAHLWAFGSGELKKKWSIGPVKQNLLVQKLQLFSYPGIKLYILDAQKNRLIETVLLSTHNICFGWEIRK